MKIIAKLVIDPRTKCLGYYKDGKFVRILTRKEFEELEIIKGGEKSGNESKAQRD